ncbi:hypothetical protein FQN60_000342 [Etheostoma spectabile]|uniref:Uncharacterized protein n=1 Tax=Etheostoma spectabile TaxID=54343 RepID=A0A5J5D196_9PERO|nr:hypothetical protein FQN60_000342 [Etheostoma spectabile]
MRNITASELKRIWVRGRKKRVGKITARDLRRIKLEVTRTALDLRCRHIQETQPTRSVQKYQVFSAPRHGPGKKGWNTTTT